MTKSYFTPSPLQAPLVAPAATGLQGYLEYTQSYELYVKKLAAAQATWKQQRKNEVAEVRAASSRGAVVKRTFSTAVTKVKFGSLTVDLPVVKSSSVEEPAKVLPPKAPEAKAATKRAKRRRNRENRKLRKAKAEAKLSMWQLRAQKNGAKLNRPPVGPTPKAAKGKAVERPPKVVVPVLTQAEPMPTPAKESVPPKAKGGSKKKKKDYFDSEDDLMLWAKAFMHSQFQIDRIPPGMAAFLKKVDFSRPGVKSSLQEEIKKNLSAALRANASLPKA